MRLHGKALLIIGSPRLSGSTSAALGTYLLNQLRDRGFETSTVCLYTALESAEDTEKLVSEIDSSELVIWAAPLYVDSVPALVIRAMELIRDHSRGSGGTDKRFVPIVNCGFPEFEHNNIAISMYRRFASEAGFQWAGHLAMGMGEMIAGRSVDRLGYIGNRIRTALAVAARGLSEENSVPQEATRLLQKSPIPGWLYVWIANRRWKKKAQKHGVRDRLNDRPFEPGIQESEGGVSTFSPCMVKTKLLGHPISSLFAKR